MNRGQLTLVARLHAEKRSRSEHSEALSESTEALLTAHESIVELVLERDAERKARLEAEARLHSASRGREAAMRAVKRATQALRELKSEAAEKDCEAQKLKAVVEAERRVREAAERCLQAEQRANEKAAQELQNLRSASEGQARAFARLQARYRTITSELKTLLADAELVAYRQSQELAQLKTELETERRAPEDAATASTESNSSRVWNRLRVGQR
jgi:hypothetical protein